VDPEAVGDQDHADHQEEAQGQHDHAGVVVDEVGERVGGQQHDHHRDDHGGHHDGQVIRHPDSRQDRVYREDHVDQDDLEDHRPEVRGDDACLVEEIRGLGVHRAVDFLGGLPQQEEAAGDQDQVAPGEGQVQGAHRFPEREDRICEVDQPGQGRQQRKAHDQGQGDAQPPSLLTLLFRQLVRQDRDKDEVVDAEHHLHRDQGDQGRPGGGVGQKGNYGVHSAEFRRLSTFRQTASR